MYPLLKRNYKAMIKNNLFLCIDFCCPKRRYPCVYKPGSRTGSDPSGGISFNIFFLGEFLYKNNTPLFCNWLSGWLIGRLINCLVS